MMASGSAVFGAAIALFVLLEKTIPFGVVSGRLAGAAMIVAGALSLAL